MTDADINKVVAEISGWTDTCANVHFLVGRPPGGGYRTDVPDYANSLDAIVPVVREWMQKEVPFSFHSASIEYDAGDDAKSRECFRASIMGRTHYTKDNPARALCLALIEAHAEMSKKGYDDFPATRDDATT